MGDIALRGNKLTKGPHGHGPKPYLNKPGQSQGTHGGRIGKADGGYITKKKKYITKKEKPKYITRKEKPKWITKKPDATKWITKKEKPKVEKKQAPQGMLNALAGGIKGKPHSSKEGVNASAGRHLKRIFSARPAEMSPSQPRRQLRKKGGWIQDVNKSIKKRGTKGVCTGKKFGGPTCRPGTKRYALAKTFKKMAKKRKG